GDVSITDTARAAVERIDDLRIALLDEPAQVSGERAAFELAVRAGIVFDVVSQLEGENSDTRVGGPFASRHQRLLVHPSGLRVEGEAVGTGLAQDALEPIVYPFD